MAFSSSIAAARLRRLLTFDNDAVLCYCICIHWSLGVIVRQGRWKTSCVLWRLCPTVQGNFAAVFVKLCHLMLTSFAPYAILFFWPLEKVRRPQRNLRYQKISSDSALQALRLFAFDYLPLSKAHPKPAGPHPSMLDIKVAEQGRLLPSSNRTDPQAP